MFGLEHVLAEELKELKAENIKKATRAVYFEGSKELLYKTNLYLRTALNILVPLKTYYVRNEDELYKCIKKINWGEYISADDTIAVESVVHSKYFRHSKYVSLKTKDTIVDQFRNKYKKRPDVDIENPSLKINIHINQEKCTVSLDSSGDSLHKRGYRKNKNQAPLNEVLAAGIVRLSGWNGKTNFVDAMCGSGTIVIEAALIAANKAPGLIRDHFGFMNWRDFDSKLWREIKKEAKQKIKPIEIDIVGSDINSNTVKIAEENLRNAGLNDGIKLFSKQFMQSAPPEGNGTLIINPPYGERMKKDDINNFYKMIGDTLKTNYTGYDAWILTSNKEALKNLGLRASKKFTLFNGPLEVKLHKYEMYKGSKKAKYL
ncbi:MAG: THUMP domain-containing protein [Ignavibacteria bacterium]